jgi:hypothetical protein
MDSKPILFNLKAKELGSQTIEIRFYQVSTVIGNIKIDTLIMGSFEPSFSIVTKEYRSNEILDKIIRVPDITIYMKIQQPILNMIF